MIRQGSAEMLTENKLDYQDLLRSTKHNEDTSSGSGAVYLEILSSRDALSRFNR